MVGSDRQLGPERFVRMAQRELGGIAVDRAGLDCQVPRIELEGGGELEHLHVKGDGALHSAFPEVYIDLQVEMRRSNLLDNTHITRRPPGINPLAHFLVLI